LRLVAKWA